MNDETMIKVLTSLRCNTQYVVELQKLIKWLATCPEDNVARMEKAIQRGVDPIIAAAVYLGPIT